MNSHGHIKLFPSLQSTTLDGYLAPQPFDVRLIT